MASASRVTGDRKLLHKYVNRGAVGVVTTSEEDEQGVSAYLIDAVTGVVLYSAHHENATGPVSIVRCENWMVYR